jgi:hypothetical protein
MPAADHPFELYLPPQTLTRFGLRGVVGADDD